MDSFESLVAMLLKRDGYWTSMGVKVDLTKDEKQKIGRPSTPRWEIDVVAYKGSTNELLAVECKSFLDSPGVVFRNGNFEPEERYKLCVSSITREVVLERLAQQLVDSGACLDKPKVTLALAAGRIATRTDRNGLDALFKKNNWRLYDSKWICAELKTAADSAFENDIAHVVSKLILRNKPEFWV